MVSTCTIITYIYLCICIVRGNVFRSTDPVHRQFDLRCNGVRSGIAQSLDLPQPEITVKNFTRTWTRFLVEEWSAEKPLTILPTLLRGKLLDDDIKSDLNKFYAILLSASVTNALKRRTLKNKQRQRSYYSDFSLVFAAPLASRFYFKRRRQSKMSLRWSTF